VHPPAACSWSAFSSPAQHRGQGRESDYFAGDKVWLYVTLLTIGYMVTRGLAKARSRDRSWEERGDRR